MKKKKNIIILTLGALLLITVLIVTFILGSKIMPLKDLNTENIWEIILVKSSNGVKYELPKKTSGMELTNILKKFTVEGEIDKDISRSYKTASINITIISEDAVSLEVYNDRVVINSVHYRADEKSFAALNSFIENINSKNANSIFESPPKLKVVCGDKEADAIIGTRSWSYSNTSTEACSSHPLMWEKFFEKLSSDNNNEVELIFAEEPKKLSIECYSDKYFGFYPDVAVSEEVEIEGNKVKLKSGGYIYVIRASFSGNNWGGNAIYAFYADAP